MTRRTCGVEIGKEGGGGGGVGSERWNGRSPERVTVETSIFTRQRIEPRRCNRKGVSNQRRLFIG